MRATGHVGGDTPAAGVDLASYLQVRRAEVDAALVTALPPSPACPPVLYDAMRYSLDAGGKRLRPILCLAGADAVGGDRAMALPAACAIELIHTYSLIHDDLPAMDDDTLRRGQPTLHVVAGEGMAILAGDGLLTEAFALLAREPASVDPVVIARKLRVVGQVAIAAGALGMVGGQALDLGTGPALSERQRAEGERGWGTGHRAPGTAERGTFDAAALARMHAMKTGAMIRAATVAGAIMGGGTDDQIDAVDRAAAELGLAFQIVDDVLDVEGGSADLGKTAGKDAAAGKLTYPALYGLDVSKRLAAECLQRAESILRTAGIADPHLLAIGRWIIDRTH